jgi:hypothetical protein
MEREFRRYGLSSFRQAVGLLELLGGLGLAIGYWLFTPLLIFSAAGLSVLMFLGILVRIKIRDPWHQIVPAFVFLLMNGYLCYLAIILNG